MQLASAAWQMMLTAKKTKEGEETMSDGASKTTTSGGIGFCGMLTILFIGLKLTGFINWSWLWVLSPLWLPLTFVLVIVVIFLIIAAMCSGR